MSLKITEVLSRMYSDIEEDEAIFLEKIDEIVDGLERKIEFLQSYNPVEFQEQVKVAFVNLFVSIGLNHDDVYKVQQIYYALVEFCELRMKKGKDIA